MIFSSFDDSMITHLHLIFIFFCFSFLNIKLTGHKVRQSVHLGCLSRCTRRETQFQRKMLCCLFFFSPHTLQLSGYAVRMTEVLHHAPLINGPFLLPGALLGEAEKWLCPHPEREGRCVAIAREKRTQQPGLRDVLEPHVLQRAV